MRACGGWVGERRGIAMAKTTLITMGWVCGAAWVASGAMAQPVEAPKGAEPVATHDEVVALREENRKLREEVGELKQAIADSRKDFSELRGQIAGLMGQLADFKVSMQRMLSGRGALAGGNSGEAQKASVPKDPMACPASMVAELRRRYEKDFHEAAAETEAGRKQRQTEVQRWCREMPKALRGRARWLVRLIDVGNEEAGKETVKYQVLDAMTREPLGEEVVSPLPLAFVVRVRGLAAGTLMEVGAVMEAEPTFNASRATGSVFDYPPLLGAYAESGVRIEWQSVEAIKDSARPTPDRNNPR